MLIEQHEKQDKPEANLWHGIEYYTSANLWQAHYTSGKGTWVIGFYPSLELAVAARAEFIEKRRNQDRESYLLKHDSRKHQQETRTENAYATQAAS